MTLLDASALFSLLARHPAAADVAALFRQDRCSILALNLAEAVDKLERVERIPPSEVESALRLLLAGGLDIQLIGLDLALAGSRLRTVEYHRDRNPVSLADCMLIAAALDARAKVATSDVPIARTAGALGVHVVLLKTSSGHLPDVSASLPSR